MASQPKTAMNDLQAEMKQLGVIDQKTVLNDIQAEIKKLGLPSLIKRNFVDISSDDGEVVRIMQWNMLAHGLCGGADGFIKCPRDALDWSTRKLRVLEEILQYQPTVLCMQEVDNFEYLMENLVKCGYMGIFKPKPNSPCLGQPGNIGPDGCALFYQSSKVTLSQSDSIIIEENGRKCNQVTIIAQFVTKDQKPFIVGTTHLKAKRGYEHVRELQGQFLSKYLGDNCADAPVIFCGDFNAEPTEPVYSVMKSCKLGLNSAYTLLSPEGCEPKYTTWKIRPKAEECHTIDYVWYCNKGLKVKSILDVASEEQVGENRLPSFRYPSDHLSLVCDFVLQ